MKEDKEEPVTQKVIYWNDPLYADPHGHRRAVVTSDCSEPVIEFTGKDALGAENWQPAAPGSLDSLGTTRTLLHGLLRSLAAGSCFTRSGAAQPPPETEPFVIALSGSVPDGLFEALQRIHSRICKLEREALIAKADRATRDLAGQRPLNSIEAILLDRVVNLELRLAALGHQPDTGAVCAECGHGNCICPGED